MLKSLDEIERLPDDSSDIQCVNVISRYTERPIRMHRMCLADFAAWYDLKIFKKSSMQKKHKSLQDLLEDDYEEDVQDDPYATDSHVCANVEINAESGKKTKTDDILNVVVLPGGTTIRRRKKKKVIRYVRYSKEKDPENYFRESLMLFYPWQCEDMLLNGCEI